MSLTELRRNPEEAQWLLSVSNTFSTGRVISALRETGLLNNTVVIFTADHGELAMEHRQFYKMSMFEGSSHVPLLVMGPGLRSGLQVKQLVSLVDLYPTVLGKEEDRKHRGKMSVIDSESFKEYKQW